MASPTTTPPPPPPPLPQFPAPSKVSSHRGHPSSFSSAFNPSLPIITAILALVIVASAAIHLLLRFLSRSSSSSPSPSPSPSSSSAPPLIHQSHSSAASSALSDQEKASLIESLPLFSLASSVAVFSKVSPDCAVCLSPFQPHDELRLLPACRHAFHSPCIDTWLRSTPSCPLCRSSITVAAPPLPPMLPAADAADNPPSSSSFRIEIGSVSRRRTSTDLDPAGAGTSLANPPPPPLPPHLRSYSLGSSFEYVVDEEVEAVVARIRRAKEDKAQPPGPLPPGEEVAEAAGGGGRNWLKEYVDRLTSSASSSFSSLRFSGRWSHRYDDGGGGGGGRDSWDLEGNYREGEGEEESGYYTFYRWLVGV